MRHGFYLATRGKTAAPEGIDTLVRRGETLGFHSVMIADHIVFPVSIASNFSGAPEQVAEDIATYARLGVSELIFDFRSESLSESVDRMERFAAEVIGRRGG